MKRKHLMIAMLTALLGACALPDTVTTSGAQRPRLLIKGAPDDALLLIDSVPMGQAQRFNGQPGVLLIEEGVHQVELRRGGTVLHAEKVLVGAGETRTLQVNEGGH